MIIQILGWAGTILIIIAYALVSFKKMEVTGRDYQLMNLIGAIGLGINVFYQKAWPALTLEIIWGLVAVISLLNIKK